MSEPCRIAVTGAAGRMGRMLVKRIGETEGCKVVAGSESEGSPFLGHDLGSLAGVGPLGITPVTDPRALFAASDVVVDFTRPEPTVRHAELAAESGGALMIGTTGLSPEQRGAVEQAAKRAPILIAANTSLGVNLLAALVQKAAAALDPGYDIEVVEMHHRMKVDAPSGTALLLGRAAAEGRGQPLEELWVKVRDGHTGEREEGTIGFATLRGGDVVGEHSVIFAGAGERLELTHKAGDRALFAAGAIKAALWLKGRPSGLYGMKDVLGL